MSLRNPWGSINPRRAASDARPVHEEVRRAPRSSVLAVGTLACRECDAPVAPGNADRLLSETLVCPFCSYRAPLREFLTLGAPTRPARVMLRVVYPARAV